MLAPMGGSTERQAADVAFEEFFRTHYATVAQLAASIVQDRHLSEDVAQDVMISAQQHWAELADDVHALGVGPDGGGAPRTQRRTRHPAP